MNAQAEKTGWISPGISPEAGGDTGAPRLFEGGRPSCLHAAMSSDPFALNFG
jgi:hypothetical protein